MPLAVLPAALALLLATGAHAAESPSTDELIEQLGAPKYVQRYEAQRALAERGLSAFDSLLAAAEHPDPEVAAASGRLLRTMTVRWTRPGDTPSVMRQLEPYGGFDESARSAAVERLARMGDEAVGALCRIARFDPSPRIAREAALLAIAPAETPELPVVPVGPLPFNLGRARLVVAAVAELNKEFGPSRRAGARWLRCYTLQDEDPKAAYEAWREAIAAERGVLDAKRPYTDELVLVRLRWHGLRSQLIAGIDAGLLDAVDELIAANPRRAEDVVIAALEWMVEAEADGGVDTVLEARREVLNTKRGLYLAAIIRDKQDRTDAAAELADAAFAKPTDAVVGRASEPAHRIDGRVADAEWLEKRGRAEWARREFAEAAAQTPPLSRNAVVARWELAESLHDHLKLDEAAQTLAEVIAAVDADDASRLRYESIRSEDANLPTLDFVRAQAGYFRAQADRARGDDRAACKRLREAIGHDGSNADLTIEFYRAAHALGDDALITEARNYVSRLADRLQQKIDANPNDKVEYNHWAWLIGNTEGDFAKAVRYSRKSLALDPGRAGFLDTLGRCYYAVGDVDEAIKQQRKAVAIDPHTQVLRRQLEFFEAERDKAAEAASGEGQTNGKDDA